MSVDGAARIELHPAELFLLWQALGLGDLPAILGVAHLGYREAERAEVLGAASAGLAGRGLGTLAEPAGHLAEALRTVASAELLLDLHTEHTDRSLRLVGAYGDRDATILGVSGESAWVSSPRRTALIAAMFEVLDPAPVPVGRTANVRVPDYEAACKAGERGGSAEFGARLREAGLRPPEVNTLSRAVGQRSGGGQFGAGICSGQRTVRRGDDVLSWLDTADGRYALRCGPEWITCTPADAGILRTMASEVVERM